MHTLVRTPDGVISTYKTDTDEASIELKIKGTKLYEGSRLVGDFNAEQHVIYWRPLTLTSRSPNIGFAWDWFRALSPELARVMDVHDLCSSKGFNCL